MNNGPLLFFGVFAALASSFWGLLLAPQLQIGRQQPVVIEATGEIYPSARPGLARQGAEVYRAQGCAECHTRQVRQTGVQFDVWLTDAGTNQTELAAALTAMKLVSDGAAAVSKAPFRLLSGLTLPPAQAIASQLTNGGAKAEALLVPLGPDIERGWGRRLTVAQDYLEDYPVQLGNLRLGPDLANVGARQPAINETAIKQMILAGWTNRPPRNDALLPAPLSEQELAILVADAIYDTNAHAVYQHLYNPQSKVPGSMMPPYRYLFEKRPLLAGEKVPEEAVLVLNRTDKNPGEAILPKPEAKALAAYLLSQRADVELPNAPVGKTPTAPSTNAPVAAPTTNAPAVPPK